MRAIWIVGAVVIACGSTPLPSGSVDAPRGSNLGSNTGSDQGSNGGSGTNVVDDVTCQTHTSTMTGSDGSRSVTDTRFAVIDTIAPGDDFAVEQCDGDETFTYYGSNGSVTSSTTIYINKPSPPTCPANYTCSDSGAPYPTVTHGCSWNKYGTFWDGKLSITCGSTQKNYNPQGVLVYTFDYNYGTIRIHH